MCNHVFNCILLYIVGQDGGGLFDLYAPGSDSILFFSLVFHSSLTYYLFCTYTHLITMVTKRASLLMFKSVSFCRPATPFRRVGGDHQLPPTDTQPPASRHAPAGLFLISLLQYYIQMADFWRFATCSGFQGRHNSVGSIIKIRWILGQLNKEFSSRLDSRFGYSPVDLHKGWFAQVIRAYV